MKLSNYLFSREFVESARLDPKHFTRCRTLTLPTVLSFLLSSVHAAVQSELDQFFANLRNRADSVSLIAVMEPLMIGVMEPV